MGGLEAGGVPELGVEEGGVVVGDERVAERDPCHDRSDHRTVGSGEVRQEPVAHNRHDPSHLMNDVLGLDIDDPSERVGVLELDDKTQHRLEPGVSFKPDHRLRDPCVIALLLVAAEGLEEGFLGWEPPIEGGSGHPGGGRDVREREPTRAGEGEHLEGGVEDALARGGGIGLFHLYILAQYCKAGASDRADGPEHPIPDR